MSDFDREAERERLREQFERDKRKREQSERMSELLLKGATMTNRHCDRCGDPIFRWDDQEFCPTCQGDPGGEPTEATGDAAGGDDTTDEPDVAESEPNPSGEATTTAAQPASDETATAAPNPDETATAAPERAGEEPAPTRPDADRRPDRSAPSAPDAAGTDPTSHPGRTATERSELDAADRDDVAAARASLARTLASLSARAESADELSSAREYLAAAKEAAEALDAAERAGR